MQYAIRTNNLSCHFGPIKAVDQLTLDIPRGIVFGFLGPNGSGKTTTIRLLLGLLEAQQGTAEVLGFDTRTQADQIRERCGALLENTGLYERLSALDNLEFYGRINRMTPDQRRARNRELLTHFGLWERREDRVKEWSQGMKQKLAIARALLHSPEMLFLDEPTASLDPVAAAALRKDIAALVEQEGVTVFLNTHNLAEAEKLCARVGVIRRGRLLTVGSPDQLRSDQDFTQLVVRGSGFNPAVLAKIRQLSFVDSLDKRNGQLEIHVAGSTRTPDLINVLVNHGVQVEEVLKTKTDLEDVFLKLMQEEADVD
jgi:ABC-2 type transport system ATP-binding protein